MVLFKALKYGNKVAVKVDPGFQICSFTAWNQDIISDANDLEAFKNEGPCMRVFGIAILQTLTIWQMVALSTCSDPMVYRSYAKMAVLILFFCSYLKKPH